MISLEDPFASDKMLIDICNKYIRPEDSTINLYIYRNNLYSMYRIRRYRRLKYVKQANQIFKSKQS